MKRLLFAALFTLIASPCLRAQDNNEWTKMFNGQDLTGWRINENPDSFSVDKGCLVVHGDRGHAFFIGKTGHTNVKNFHFKAKVMTKPGANSGIYFHTQFLATGWPDRGYEAQVNNTQQDKKKTGGLYNVQDNFEAPVKDNEWFDYEIIVQGKHIVIKINGKTISDYTEPNDLDRPARQLSSGTFALQAHDPGSQVLYKDLWFKVLKDL
ncbi:MAG: hypothetical protein ACI87E_000226 [Mariniblastus sp.]|jgi:hypothetical protein